MPISVITPAAKGVQVKTAKIDSTIGTTQTDIFGLEKDSVPLYFTVASDATETGTMNIGDASGGATYADTVTIGALSPVVVDGAAGAVATQYTPITGANTLINVTMSAAAVGTIRINCFYFVTNRGEDSLVTV